MKSYVRLQPDGCRRKKTPVFKQPTQRRSAEQPPRDSRHGGDECPGSAPGNGRCAPRPARRSPSSCRARSGPSSGRRAGPSHRRPAVRSPARRRPRPTRRAPLRRARPRRGIPRGDDRPAERASPRPAKRGVADVDEQAEDHRGPRQEAGERFERDRERRHERCRAARCRMQSAQAGVRSDPASASSAAPNAPTATPSSSASRSARLPDRVQAGRLGAERQARQARRDDERDEPHADRAEQLDRKRDLGRHVRLRRRPPVDRRRDRHDEHDPGRGEEQPRRVAPAAPRDHAQRRPPPPAGRRRRRR